MEVGGDAWRWTIATHRTVWDMSTDVIVLNGGSSSGKSTIARHLQAMLAEPWLVLGADTLVDALPESLRAADDGIEVAADGKVTMGHAFEALDLAWTCGIAAMARAGAHVIVDEVFLGGPRSQARWRAALDGMQVLWVGVRCDGVVAARREEGRGDRTVGMAVLQAEAVHQGVTYDLEIDTTRADAATSASTIAALVSGAGRVGATRLD